MANTKMVKLVNGLFPQEMDDTADIPVLPTNMGTLQGIGVSATPATTGAMTITMTAAKTAFSITPTGACTFNASGSIPGARVSFIVTTNGVSSFVLTWGTNFRSIGTLATGTTTAKIFVVSFLCTAGGIWVETGRTAAQ